MEMQANKPTNQKDNEYEETSLLFSEIEHAVVSLDNAIVDISPKVSEVNIAVSHLSIYTKYSSYHYQPKQD